MDLLSKVRYASLEVLSAVLKVLVQSSSRLALNCPPGFGSAK